VDLADSRNFVDRAQFPEQRVIFSDVDELRENEIHSVNWRNSYFISDEFRIESETNYFEAETKGLEDRDLTATPGSINEYLYKTSTFDQELRLHYESERLRAVVGGFYAVIDSDNDDVIVSPGFSISATSLRDTENVAAFGEVEYDLTPQLTLIAGARYDRETTKNEITGGFTQPESSATFDAFLPKAGAVYRFTDDVSLGFTWQRGYRAGGSGINLATGQPFTFDPEFTDNYELAFRSEWLDNRLAVNANAFYTNWSDQQVNEGTNFLDIVTTNAGSSRLYGGELAVEARPINGLNLFGSVAYVNTEFTDFVNGGTDFSGNQFPDAAKWTAFLGAEYRFGGGFFVAGDGSYTSSAFTDAANTDDRKTDSRLLTNARVGYEQDNWAVTLFATNLFDDDYITSGGTNFVTVGDPREVGLKVDVRF
jgi:outer membrane receptor protein involved in Fe transport